MRQRIQRIKSGELYMKKRCKEEGFSAYFDYSWQWNYRKKFEDAGIMALLGTGFDQVLQVYSVHMHLSITLMK